MAPTPPAKTPTLRALNHVDADPRYWDDPDLAPAPRHETPLDAFA
jgi:hypothetical protein